MGGHLIVISYVTIIYKNRGYIINFFSKLLYKHVAMSNVDSVQMHL